MLLRLLLTLVVCLPAAAQLRLTPQAQQAGYRLSTFAENFPQAEGVGPTGIAFPDAGGVLVVDYPGNIRRFANRNDGQRTNTVQAIADLGAQGGGLTKSGGKIYAGDQRLGRLLQLNDNGSVNSVVIESGFLRSAGLATHPMNGQLYVSLRDVPGTPDRIAVVQPATRAVTTF